jgi:hypothetical protein
MKSGEGVAALASLARWEGALLRHAAVALGCGWVAPPPRVCKSARVLMATSTIESRRAFLRGVLGTGAAALAVSACQLQVGASGPGDGVPYQPGVVEAAEVVPLRPGVRYEAAMPASVPAVRKLATAGALTAN